MTDPSPKPIRPKPFKPVTSQPVPSQPVPSQPAQRPRQLHAWPAEGRLCGIDYGTVRIGLSICDPSRTWASPLETYTRRTDRLDEDYFRKLVGREGIVGWVVGLPIHCDGNESQKSWEVRKFTEWLSLLTDLPCRFFDERFSTAFANRLLGEAELTRKKKKAKLDSVAAQLILEGYLESERLNRVRNFDPLE